MLNQKEPVGCLPIIITSITGYLIVQSIVNEKTKELMIIKTIVYASAIIVLYAIFMIFRRSKPKPRNELIAMSAVELDFFHRLKIALPDNLVLTQMQYANYIRTRHYVFGKITRWQTDFMICKKDSKVIAWVMLASKSRNESDQTFDINTKVKFAQSLEIPFILFDYENPPSIEAIQTEFKKLFHKEATTC